MNNINCYILASKEVEILKRDWFLKSLKDPWNVISTTLERDKLMQDGGDYQSPLWYHAVQFKTKLIYNSVLNNQGKLLYILMSIFSFLEELLH